MAFRTIDVQDRQRALILFPWLLSSGWVCVPSSPANRKGIQMCGNQVRKQQSERQTVESPVFCFFLLPSFEETDNSSSFSVWNLESLLCKVQCVSGPLSRLWRCSWTWWMLSAPGCTLPTSLWERYTFQLQRPWPWPRNLLCLIKRKQMCGMPPLSRSFKRHHRVPLPL